MQVLKATLNGVSPVAIKVLKDQSLASREVFWREVAMLKSLRNSNIVQFQVGPQQCPPFHFLQMTNPLNSCVLKPDGEY